MDLEAFLMMTGRKKLKNMTLNVKLRMNTSMNLKKNCVNIVLDEFCLVYLTYSI